MAKGDFYLSLRNTNYTNLKMHIARAEKARFFCRAKVKVGSINCFQEISRVVLSRLLAFMKE